jgi:hypothetical protein
MKKEIGVAVVATFLVLQLIGNTVGGFIGDLANSLADSLSSRIQIEQMIQSGDY